MSRNKEILCLFDVDGTLTEPRQEIDCDMLSFLKNKLLSKCAVGLVSGSDLEKIIEQMGGSSFNLADFDYIFPENGLIAIKNGQEIAKESIASKLGEENLQKLINYALGYMSKLELPVKRGTFIEFRAGLINICPVGRSCSQDERIAFNKFDAVHKIREKFIEDLKKQFADLNLKFSIGGQISIDVFPVGWDKSHCLKFVEDDFKGKILFFGDKTNPGENDFEIFNDSRVIGYHVTSPEHTRKQLEDIFELK